MQRDSAPIQFVHQTVDVEGSAAHASHNEVSRVVAFGEDRIRQRYLDACVPSLVTVTSKEPPIYDDTSRDGCAVIAIGVLV